MRPTTGARLRISPAAIVLATAALFPRVACCASDTQTDKPQFAVFEYRVIGNTVLRPIDVERAVYPHLGEARTFDDVEAARAALEAAYRAHDYGTVFVDVPEQDVTDGVVRLRVTEGRLRQTRISGAKYFSERKLLAAVPAAAQGHVPALGELQRELAAVNSESADRALVPVLKAGPYPGTVDLALRVEDHLPLHGSVELNDQYTVGTSHLRATASLAYADLFGDLDSLALQYQASPQKTRQVGVFAASYTTGPLADAARLALTYVHSGSNVPTVGTFGVLGRGDIWSARLTVPVAYTSATTQNIILGFDYKHFRESIALDANTALVTPISYGNFSAGYAGDWRAERHQWSTSATANLGLRGLINEPVAFENKRYLARPNYFYLRGDAGWTEVLPAHFLLRLRLSGQYALDPLISNENFSIGGVDGVRGYLEAEELGDVAIKGAVELLSPTIAMGRSFGARGLVFLDAGHIHVLEALAGQADHASLRSVGTGVDVFGGASFSGTLIWAYPLAAGSTTREGDARVRFSVRGAF